MSDSWTAVITELESRLASAEAAIELGQVAVLPEFEAPAVAGPVPPELEERARALVDRGARLQQHLEGEAARIGREIARLPRIPRPQGTARFEVDA